MARFWTCQRQSKGVKCGAVNPRTNTYCRSCSKRRPPHIGRTVANRYAIDETYEQYLARQGGVERCLICGAPPGTRRLHRDHEHGTRKPRGLLCFSCNVALPERKDDPTWLRAAAAYLEQYT